LNEGYDDDASSQRQPKNGSKVLKWKNFYGWWWAVRLTFYFKVWTSNCPSKKHP
jgi:hypothetical protein